jgi:hypothetical protein
MNYYQSIKMLLQAKKKLDILVRICYNNSVRLRDNHLLRLHYEKD